MKYTVILMCYYSLIVTHGGNAKISECPSLDADTLASVKAMVVKENVHEKLVGSSRDLWGAKAFFDKDPDTCVKHSREFINDTVLNQTVEARGKWFPVDHKRNALLVKEENNIYLEYLPKQVDGEDFVLSRVYVIYAKNGVFGYFWCLVFDAKTAHLPSLAGVTVHPDDLSKPEVQDAANEAIQMIQDNKDILGEIAPFDHSC